MSESIYELDDVKLGQFFQVKKQTEYEKLPLEDGFWIIGKLIHPHVRSMDSNIQTDPAFLAVWADSSHWRNINESVKQITVREFKKMGDRVSLLNLGEQSE